MPKRHHSFAQLPPNGDDRTVSTAHPQRPGIACDKTASGRTNCVVNVKCPAERSNRFPRLYQTMASIALFCTAALGYTEVDQAYYDWIPVDQLTEEQRQHLSPACKGAYIDPLAKVDNRQEMSKTPIAVEAGRVDMNASAIQLEGDVSITQGDRRIKAQYMSFDRQSDLAEMRELVEIRQPGILVRGSGAAVNMAGREAQFEGGEFVLHQSHLRGSAAKIEHQADGVVVLQNGQITSCEPGAETWQIKGKSLRVDPIKKQGSGRNVTIEVAGIPIVYVPYITFPVGSERQSGLLIPTVGVRKGELDLTIPWYWNIAPNYDATIAPRYAAGHGAMVESEWRYMNSVSHNALNLALLPNDKGGGYLSNDPQLDEAEKLRSYRGTNRWLVSLDHAGGDNSRWYSDIEYAKVSDVDYFRDISPESFSVANNTYLNQSATLGYRLPNWNINARIQAYQNLLVDLDANYRQLPRVQMNGRYTYGAWGISLNHEWADFTHEDLHYVTGQRANLDYQVEWNQQFQWGYVRPQVGVQTLAYLLDDDNLSNSADTNPVLGAPYASIDAALTFERDNGRQTLEPRLFYLFRNHTDHSALYDVTNPDLGEVRDVNFDTTPLTFGYDQMFRNRRFAGGDRIGDANQLTVALTSQWLSENRNNPIASISLGQVLYFSDQQVTLQYREQVQALEESDLATKITAQLSRNIQVRGDFLYNPKEKQVMRATTGIEYQDDDLRRIKLGYRFVREDRVELSTLPVDQLDTAFSLPFGEQWQVVGRLFYDLDEHKELDAFLGFEYDDCCYRLRLLARRWLDSTLATLVNDRNRYDDGIFLEIDLKGLASSGERIQRLLAETIPGFREQ